jgi:uncharacterized membrane protein YbhN (UPF0104 family)
MDWQALAVVVGLCSLFIALAVYVLSRLSLFSPPKEEAPPAGNEGSRSTGVSLVFFGLMVVCVIGVSAWGVQALELEGRTAIRAFFSLTILVGLVFLALYLALKSLGVPFAKKPKQDPSRLT